MKKTVLGVLLLLCATVVFAAATGFAAATTGGFAAATTGGFAATLALAARA